MTTNDDERPDDLLVRLGRLNPTVVVLATVALFLAALLLPDPVGAVLFLLIAAGLGGLLSRTWPVLAVSARVLRLIVIVLIVLVALVKLFL